MRRVFVLTALVAAAVATAQPPRFHDAVMIDSSGVPIDVGYYGAPVMFDWNGDGNKDLICGQFTSGLIRFYPNIGSDSAPEFCAFDTLYADGAPITLPSG